MNKTKSIILLSLMAVLMALFLVLNMEIPFIIDDYVYSRSFVGIDGYCGNTNPDRLVNSISEFGASLWAHVHFINGRFLIAGLQHIFCGIADKWVYDSILAAMFCLMLYLLAYGREGKNTLPQMGMAAFMMLFLFNIPSTFYEGVSVSINYVLPTITNIGLLLLLNKRKADLQRFGKTSRWLIVLAAIAASCHENFSVPIAATFFLLLIFRCKTLGKGERAIFATYIVFATLIVLAPANIERFLAVTPDSQTAQEGIIYHIRTLKYLRITYIYILVAGLFAIRRGGCWLKEYIKENHLLLISMPISVAFALMIGALNGRVVYATEIFATLLILQLFEDSQMMRRWSFSIATFGFVLSIALIAAVTGTEQTYVKTFHEAEQQVQNCKTDSCIINVAAQDTLPPQLQKYVVATINPFQLEQWRWKNKKKSVALASPTNN